MKQKNTIKSLLIGILLSFVNSACQQGDLENEPSFNSNADEFYVNSKEAELIASVIEFPDVLGNKEKDKARNRKDYEIRRLSGRTVKQIKSAPGKQNLDLFHIVNYEEGGWIIIAGDKRATPILAFSDE
ncbi:Spi family protease inhibitor [Algoriphagus aestuariicola]|uniref:Spi family protease inhibitor n=1 Tax=Algoriphagus aestuariicola TaxID=1852016 RepID=A0ABS3BTQ8_9BACT|nr:Spi family protease inhibitor [Algoriphagus aestuariicola]MBN7801651.1 Spi family protease inhibitor [Algoriphagus aestuariicola]